MNSKTKFLFLIIAIPLIIVIFSLNFISYNFTTYLWFESHNQTQVWWRTWIKQVQFYLLGSGISIIGYYISYYLGSRSLRKSLGGGSFPALTRILYLAVPIAFAFFIHGPAFSSIWPEYILASLSPDFGIKDPLFNRDASFFMFQLDWYSAILGWIKGYLVMLGLYSASLYLLPMHSINFETESERFKRILGMGLSHLAIILGLFVLILAFNTYVDKYSLVFEGGSNKFAGASYTDVHARQGAYTIFFYLGLLLSVLIIASSFIRSWKAPAMAAGAWLLVYIILLKIYPWAVQTISVNPNELTAETPYINSSIKYTRIGYGLDRVKKQQFNPRGSVSASDLKRNSTIVKNIRLWDYRPIRDTYKQLQEIKPYYEFRSVDIDRYVVNGELRQVLLSARELNYNELPTRARSWIQTHLQYTHGYGIVMSPSNRVTAEGQPELWIKDFPPKTYKGIPEIKTPGIYYGELSDEYVVVKTAMSEIDYPKEKDFAKTRYSGKGGVRLGSGLRKTLISMQFDTWKMLVSNEVKPDSKVLFNRQIHEAVRLLAPFLIFDRDPYIVVGENGRLYWLMDAYTVSDKFPYSRRFDGDVYKKVRGTSQNVSFRGLGNVNYIRNSVKIVIDAYDGTITMYRFDEKDPVIRAWSNFLPELFKPVSEMPEFLKSHLRYPEMLFLVQAGIYTNYHMDNPQAFFNGEDRWEIATELYSKRRQRVEPYYTVIKLPGEKKVEYILMLPFVPKSKRNLIAWMAARCDYKPIKDGKSVNNYGQIILLDFPRTRQFYGPIQIESRIDQDPEISKDLTLWDQKGSQVIRGNLLVIPVENSLLYVEPVYLQSTQSPFPEFKRVVVADSHSVIMRESLNSALGALTNQSFSTTSSKKTDAVAGRSKTEVAREARSTLRRARQAAGAGKWREFGRAMEKLENLLNRLAKGK